MTPWTAARQASLSITNSQNLLKLMSIELVMPSNHLILCHPLLLPAFNLSQNQGLFQWVSSSSVGQSIGASASASVLPMTIQDWFPIQLTGLISLQSIGLSRVFSNTPIQKYQLFGTQPSYGQRYIQSLSALLSLELVQLSYILPTYGSEREEWRQIQKRWFKIKRKYSLKVLFI